MESTTGPAQGFTVVELITSVAIVSILAFVVIPNVKIPLFLSKSVTVGEKQNHALRAMDVVINDIKEAYPALIPWATISPEADAPLDSIVFQKANFSAGNITPDDYNTIEIRYNATTRELVRTETFADGTPTKSSILFENMESPTTVNPLFQKDVNPDVFHVIIVTIMYTQPDMPVQRLIRRIAAKG